MRYVFRPGDVACGGLQRVRAQKHKARFCAMRVRYVSFLVGSILTLMAWIVFSLCYVSGVCVFSTLFVPQELEAMKKRLREMEEEAAKLKDIQEQSSAELSGNPAGAPAVGAGPAAAAGGPAAAAAATAETDARSIYVGSVDYSATPEELQAHFADCGTVNRVTILCNKFTGHPKGYAYIEFADEDGVKNATILNDSMFKDRQIKVCLCIRGVPACLWRAACWRCVYVPRCVIFAVENVYSRWVLVWYALVVLWSVSWPPLTALDGTGGPEALERARHERGSHVHARPRPRPRPWRLPWRRLPGWRLPRRLPRRVWRAPAVGPVLAAARSWGSPILARPPGRTPFLPRCALLLCAPRLRRNPVARACRCCGRNPVIEARVNLVRARAHGRKCGDEQRKKKKRTKKKKERSAPREQKEEEKKEKKEMGGNGGNGGAPGALVLVKTRPRRPSCWLLGRSPTVASTALAGGDDGADSPRRDARACRCAVLRWTHHAGYAPALLGLP